MAILSAEHPCQSSTAYKEAPSRVALDHWNTFAGYFAETVRCDQVGDFETHIQIDLRYY